MAVFYSAFGLKHILFDKVKDGDAPLLLDIRIPP